MFKHGIILFIYLFIYLSVINCSSLKILKKYNLNYGEFHKLKIGEASKGDVLEKFGQPDHIYYLDDDKKIVTSSELSQWVYKDNKFNRLYFYFESDTLQSGSWEVLADEKESNIKEVLNNFKGAKWQIFKEPVTNPHVMPSECKIIDSKSGFSISINGYKKRVNSISKWNPDKFQNIKPFDDSRPEFCIAGHCSRVADPGAWQHNHCKWLDKLIKK